MADAPEPVERVDWSAFRRRYFNRRVWRNGQHVSLLGRTGAGKTTVEVWLVGPDGGARRDVVIIDVKGDDPKLNPPPQGYVRLTDWPPDVDQRRVVLAPRTTPRSQLPAARRITARALDDIYEGKRPYAGKLAQRMFGPPPPTSAAKFPWKAMRGAGDHQERVRWTVVLDETRVITDGKYMGLQAHVEALWLFARSRGISVVAGTQAPRWVPRAMYDQATYLFIWRPRDVEAVKRLAEIGGDTPRIRAAVNGLGKHDFLFVDADRDRMVVSRLELPRRG